MKPLFYTLTRALSILLMLALVIGLAACLGDDTPADTTQNTEETAAPDDDGTTEEITTEEVTTEAETEEKSEQGGCRSTLSLSVATVAVLLLAGFVSVKKREE